MRRAALLSLSVLLVAVPAPAASPKPCPVRVERAGGGTWEARRVEGLSEGPAGWRMAADESDPALVVIADYSGILVTRDGGCTWERRVEYAELLAPFTTRPLDAGVAGGGRTRSLHVLVDPWLVTGFEGPNKLLSSFDDGRTWTVGDLPAAAGRHRVSSLSLTTSPRSPNVVYLLAHHAGGSTLFVGDGRDEWRWQSAAAFGAPATACGAGDTCVSRLVDVVHADPAEDAVLWGFMQSGPGQEPAFIRSEDRGRSWEGNVAPDVGQARPLLDVSSGGRAVLLGDFSAYAMSDDGGRSWAVGRLPDVRSDEGSPTSVFDLAHFGGGRSFATVFGTGPSSRWAGDLVVFDGRRWRSASPRGFGSSGGADGEEPPAFADLTGTDGPLLALTSRGELMSFRL